MARRKKTSVTAEMFTASFDMLGFALELCGWFVEVALKVAVWLLEGLWSMLKALCRGIKWVVIETRRENRELDEHRREIWEERWERWFSRRYPNPIEDYEEEEKVVYCEPTDPEPPLLPPFEFKFVGRGDAPVEEPEPEEEVAPEPVAVVADAGEDDVWMWMPGGSPEKAIPILERRLEALYDRKEKAEYVNRADEDGEEWRKFKNTKAWRSLLWDIEYVEEKLAYLERALG